VTGTLATWMKMMDSIHIPNDNFPLPYASYQFDRSIYISSYQTMSSLNDSSTYDSHHKDEDSA
jgi:hypothetical protein